MRKLLIFLFLLFYPIIALAEYYEIDQYSVTINVNRDTTMRVVEDIFVSFNAPRRGIFRFIPLDYIVNNKVISSIDISDVSIKRNSQKEDVKIYNQNGNIVLKIGNANRTVNGKQLYTIEYTVDNAIDFFKNIDLFMWNITGNQHPVNIKRINFYIEFPQGINIIEPYIYVGREGSNERLTNYNVNNNTLSFTYGDILPAYSGISLLIDFQKGIFSEPTFREKIIRKCKKYLGMIIVLFIAVIGTLIGWLKYGRNDYVAIPVQYYPPQDMDSALFGYVVDSGIDKRDIISLIFYWASKGILKVKETNDDFKLIKLKELENPKLYEKTFFNNLFGKLNETSINNFEKSSLYDVFRYSRETLSDYAKKQKIYAGHVGRKISILCILAPFLTIPFIKFGQMDISTFLAIFFASMFGCVFFSSNLFLKRTSYGNKVYAKVKGFEEFLKKVENPQLEVLMKNDVDYCNKVLPYAIAAGVENEFLKKMRALFIPMPEWCEDVQGIGGFHNMINSSIADISSAVTPPPTSHSSFESSSRGFSGGGHGGGGSGSW